MHQALQIFKNHGERVRESQKSFISVNKNLKYSTKVLYYLIIFYIFILKYIYIFFNVY